MKSQAIVVGVDGGGTKTSAAAHSVAHGQTHLAGLVGEGLSGPCNIAFMPLADALGNLKQAVAACGAAPEQIDSLCAAVAGFSFESRRIDALRELQAIYPNTKIRLVPDYFAAFRGALPGGEGIVVIAGTGSVAFGASSGKEHRAGGYGYLIDDAGSGYGVGREAVAAVLQQIDGTGPQTSLSQMICEELRVSSWDGLIEAIYGGTVDRVRIASLAKCVARAAKRDGDEVANRILMRAGGALARLAESVYRNIYTSETQIEIARIGSLWEAGSRLTDTFERSCVRFAKHVQFVEAADGPVAGAAKIAADLLNVVSLEMRP